MTDAKHEQEIQGIAISEAFPATDCKKKWESFYYKHKTMMQRQIWLVSLSSPEVVNISWNK